MSTEENNSTDEYLTTVGELNPLLVLERAGAGPAVVVAVGVYPSGSQTGLLKERGGWVRRLWEAALNQMPDAQGARLLWHTAFFVIPTADGYSVAPKFERLLQALYDPALESYCLINVANGNPPDKLQLLDEMQSAISSDRNFKEAQGSLIKLLNGVQAA